MNTVSERLATALADRYRIERELGQGGMATVYLAHDLKHGRDVALKVLRPELAAVLGSERFLNEVRITSRLQHPHIVTLIDSGETDGFLWYVLPYIRGESLRHRLDREKQLGVDDALAITRQVAGALDYAHQQGVIHRDIKPENILLHEGEAMLADFGIALAVQEAGGNRLTETGLSLGTPQYMSPEQATGDRDLDARSDVYSLGAVLYEMLAGEPPVTGPNARAIIAKLMTERPTRLRVVRDAVPEGVDAAVAKALGKVPADRFSSAATFASALSSGVHVSALTSRRSLSVRWLAGAGIVVALASVWIVSSRGGKRTTPSLFLGAIAQQLTTSGQVVLGSTVLSPDGSLLAYTEERCENGTDCRGELLIRETAGEGVSTIVSRPGHSVYPRAWSPDGRWVLFGDRDAVTGAWTGPYIVSQRGGTPRLVAPGGLDGGFVALDTIVLAEFEGQQRWLRRVVASTGLVVDSVLLPIGRGFGLVEPSPNGARLLVTHQDDLNSDSTTLSIIDRNGRTTDSLRLDAYSAAMGPLWWGPDAVILALSARSGMIVLRRRLDGQGRFLPGTDTLATTIDLAGEQVTLVGLSPDGTQLFYGKAQSDEVSYWTATRDDAKGPFLRGRKIGSSTGQLGVQLSDRGGWIIITTVDGPATRRAVEPFTGGERHIIDMPQTGAQWAFSPLDDSIAVTAAQGTGRFTVTSYPLPSGVPVPRGTFDGVVDDLEWISDGRLVSPVDSGRAIRVFGPGAEVKDFRVPDSLGAVMEVGPSPSAPELAVRTLAYRHNEQEYLVSRLNLSDGRFTRVARNAMLGTSGVWWTTDNWVHITGVLSYSGQLSQLYRVPIRGGSFEAEPPIGFESNAAVVGLSHDGRRAVVRVQSHNADLWVLRTTAPK